jgi:hypothetical protein
MHAMTRIRALLRNLAAFRKFNRTFCVVCLFSGTLTGILLSITAFREFGNTGKDHSPLIVYLMVALTTLNTITTILFTRHLIRLRREVAKVPQRQQSNVLAELFAKNEMGKSTLTLVLSFVLLFAMMFCKEYVFPRQPISSVWLVVTLVPAGLSCLNSLLINLRVSAGEFGFNSLEGMEIIHLLKKRGVHPPNGGGPRIFRDFRHARQRDAIRDFKDVRTA